MRISTLLATGLIVLICSVIADAGEPAVTASVVLRHIEKVGPSQALQDYFENRGWAQILDGIGSGDAQWLEVYARLSAVSDAAASEELDDALYDSALPREPFRVFVLIEREEGSLSGKPLCNFTFEAQCPPGGITPYLDRLERALRNARTPWERSIRDACFQGIQATRAAIPDERAYCAGDAQPAPGDAQ